MKKLSKLLIVTALSSFALSAQAEGWYVQGDLGYSRIAEVDYDIVKDNVLSQRVSVGYDFANKFRVAADYTNFGTAKTTYENLVDVSLKIKSLGLTGFYDFNINSKFTPYVGVRLAYNKADIKASTTNTYSRYYTLSDSASESRLGIGALAGVQYDLAPNLKINAGVEYNRIAADVAQAGVKVGIRYNF
ncbi:hypothetical protein A1D22_07295 [Pasteurellaceae bacterium LFhippo2]|nr:hypothetical protein [Pasteurellaceae bacterium LFhippo2]